MRQYANPKTITERIAVLYAERKDLEKRAEELKREETALLEQCLTLFPRKDVTQVILDSGAKVTLGTQIIATVQSWPLLVADVAAHYGDERWQSVLHKRVSPTAIEKLSYDGVLVAGAVLDHKKVATFSARAVRKED